MTLTLAEDREVALSNRAKILTLEARMLDHPEAKTAKDYPLQEHFAPGTYAREIFMPRGNVVVGKIHRHAHVNVLSAGACEVFTEGGGLEVLEAPTTWISQPGTKRTVRMLSDVMWTTIHANPLELRGQALHDWIIAPDYAALEVTQ